ncbi:MAG: GTP-binding protein HflX, partial [Humibacillus sp.]|nr:GTP-binding protein HflX [Humibacillus sp.]
RIHEEGEILESEHVADGTRVRAKVTPVIEADLAAYAVVAS